MFVLRQQHGAATVAEHRHRRGQLQHAAAGVLHVQTMEGRWVVPPQRGVWIPPHTPHGLTAARPFDLCTLYVDGSRARSLPSRCCVIAVSPLLDALLLQAARYGTDWPRRGCEERLLQVALDLAVVAPAEPLHLPLPTDRRARRVAEALSTCPGDRRLLAQWAVTVGASERTLARLFVCETGLSFVQWRRQCRLLAAVARLGEGFAVTAVALDVGYDNVSAFGRDFKRTLGKSPSAYFQCQ